MRREIPKVSVVIPNYNGEKILKECIDSVQAQKYPNLELIIVDDHSPDQSVDLFRDNPSIRLIENAENSGFAYSVNRGIQAARGEFVILLNNDVVLKDNFIESLVDAIEEDSKIFSVSSKMLRYKEPEYIDDTGDFINLLGWGWKRGDGMPAFCFQEKTEVFSACAGAAIYRKKIFPIIGYFDEAHFAYLEDIDIGWRALIYGYKNMYEPKAQCLHIGSATMAQGQRHSPFKVRISARNTVYILYKNMPFPFLLLNSPFLGLGFAVKYVYFANRGFAKDYLTGLSEGFKNASKLNKVKINTKNIKSFLRIEEKLLLNVFRYGYEKVEKFII